jgi:DNA-binding NarL/FixJ family response regulator
MSETFCIPCSSMACAHINRTPSHFTAREISMLRSLLDPMTPSGKQIAHNLGITEGTLKVYFVRMHKKLGWRGGSTRMLTLWVVAHAAELGVPLPTPDSFRTL